MDSREFAIEVVRNSERNAARLKEAVLDAVPTVDEPELIKMLQFHMWSEYHNGCLPPIKMIPMLADSDLDIKDLLTLQIAEEYLHYKVFRDMVAERGADADITRFRPSPGQRKLFHWTYGFDNFIDIATCMQCTGEVVLITILKRLITLLDHREGKIVADNVLIHEGSHVRNGRLILERYATTPEIQDHVARLSQRRFDVMMETYAPKTYGEVPA